MWIFVLGKVVDLHSQSGLRSSGGWLHAMRMRMQSRCGDYWILVLLKDPLLVGKGVATTGSCMRGDICSSY